MNRLVLPVAIVALVSLLAGCASTSSSTAPRPAAAGPAVIGAPVKGLEKGMSADAVRKLLGKPAEITMLVTSDGMAEVWVYHRNLQQSRLVATGTRTATAQLGTMQLDAIPEPVYSLESNSVEETLRLLMFQGKLHEWTRQAQEGRAFN